MTASAPLVIEPAELESGLGDPDLIVIDLCKVEIYQAGHIQGAIHLEYSDIVEAHPPISGLLPDEAHMSALLSAIGFADGKHIVAYDDEGGGKAARLLWTLAAYGLEGHSMLNGGLHAWANEGHPLEATPVKPVPTQYQAHYHGGVVADRDYIAARLGDEQVLILDTRTQPEYHGHDVRAARGGRIPGALHFEWTRAMDRSRNLRIREEDELRRELEALGVTPDKEIICYCQTHHRSAHTWALLRHLGYTKVKGYPGAWSDWGNASHLPLEHGPT
ncbi:thiosulfate sulfurtransferase [Acidihalobacter yilgarnensis]|uniref:Thiosulfate sulfurtransferase n=1 Tax=Acidihalobacter yilgarnensis TaxID=2819280 RepID=A0A1D8IM85_9GAMM|nr:sulfurtransferase [Acidihalobacter yilgarnensis]AOU97568.1 thiosulfate sulfurtransferase [Acidihalobacter yilgarnensis]